MTIANAWYQDRAPRLRGVGSGYVAPGGDGNAVGFHRSMLYDFPLEIFDHNAGEMSLSVWVRYDSDMGITGFVPDPTIGTLLQSPFIQSYVSNKYYYNFEMTPGLPGPVGINATVDQDFTHSVASATTSFPAGWNHLGFSLRAAAGVITRLAYLNNTQILNDSFTFTPAHVLSDPYQGSLWSIYGGSFRDGLGFLNTMNIGGSPYGAGSSAFAPFSGDPETFNGQLYAGVGHWWYDLGRFVNWADATTRAKFFTASGGGFVPASIGSDGSTPFGVAPLVYLKGGAAAFPVNRGSLGGTMTVWGTLLNGDAGGLVF